MLLTICGDMAKIGISSQIPQNVLDLVGVLMGMIFQILVWQSPKERCYGNPLNMGGVCKRRMERIYSMLRHSTMDWPIINPLSKFSMAIMSLHRI